MKKPIFVYFFLLLYFPISAQSVVDSLTNLIATTDDDSLKMEWYNQLRKATIFQDLNQAMGYAENYIELAQKIENPFKIAIGKVYKGNIHIRKTEYETAIDLLLQSVQYFENQNDSVRIGSVYNSIAAAYEYLGRDSLTQVYFQKSYDIFSNLQDQRRLAMALNNLSNIHFRNGEYRKTEQLLRRGISTLQASPDPDIIQYLPTLNTNLGNALVGLKQYAEAEQIYKSTLQSVENQDNNYIEAVTNAGLGRSQLRQNNASTALPYLQRAEQIMNEFEYFNIRNDLLYDLAQAYEKTGNYKLATIKLRSYQTIQDSLFNEEKTTALANALQKYEADKKNQQIALLSSQNELKDLRLLKNSRERWALIGGLLALGLIAGLVFRNNRLRAKANAELEKKNTTIAKALEEKSLLLKEIHHRVKNNLQVISSLLRLQSRYIDDENALEAINESQNRVRSMSLLHQNLYQDDNLTGVEVQIYFNQLIDELFQSYQVNQEQIKIIKNIEQLHLDVDTVIPLGLIVNELISNALKYAFVESEAGEIKIELQSVGNELLLQVSDNGIGIDPEIFTSSKSFGNRMIRAFAAKLEGKLAVFNRNGTVVEMRFSGQ